MHGRVRNATGFALWPWSCSRVRTLLCCCLVSCQSQSTACSTARDMNAHLCIRRTWLCANQATLAMHSVMTTTTAARNVDP